MLLIVAMVGIEEIAYLTNLVLEMDCLNFRIVQLRVLLICQVLVPVSAYEAYLETSRVTYAWQVPRLVTLHKIWRVLWSVIGT